MKATPPRHLLAPVGVPYSIRLIAHPQEQYPHGRAACGASGPNRPLTPRRVLARDIQPPTCPKCAVMWDRYLEAGLRPSDALGIPEAIRNQDARREAYYEWCRSAPPVPSDFVAATIQAHASRILDNVSRNNALLGMLR